MDEKSLKKKSTVWGCDHGCDVRTKPCRHIEVKLAVRNGTMSRELREKIETNKLVDDRLVDQDEYEQRAKKLELALAKAGLENFRTELLMDKFVDNLSLREIAKNRGYLRHEVVWKLINETLSRLKALGPESIRKLLKHE